jgi:hypothetical protein
MYMTIITEKITDITGMIITTKSTNLKGDDG